jgi:hypothetical protein
LYGITALGNSGGTTNITLGTKTGTGDDATGAQGGAIQAASSGARWFGDFDDPNVDAVNLYGVQLIHGGDFQLDDVSVDVVSCSFIDCTSATLSNSNFLRNSIINPNTADGVAFAITDDLSDIVFCTFEWTDGHAVELTTPRVATQSSKGNIFTGFAAQGGNANDRAIYNNTAGAVEIAVSENGTSPSYRDGTSASTTITNAVTVRIEGVTEGASCKVIANETVGTITAGDIIFEQLANSSGVAELTTFNYEGAFDPSGLDVIVRARASGNANATIADDNGSYTDETLNANNATGNDMNLLPATPVVNEDRYIIGDTEQFNGIKFDVSTAGTGGFTITWQYWNGAWTNLSGVVDGTSSFSNAGENKVTWTMPGDWVTSTINSQGPFYYIRAAYTAGTVTITPLARRCTLNITRYLPFYQERIIESTGLTVVASWVENTIAQF